MFFHEAPTQSRKAFPSQNRLVSGFAVCVRFAMMRGSAHSARRGYGTEGARGKTHAQPLGPVRREPPRVCSESPG